MTKFRPLSISYKHAAINTSIAKLPTASRGSAMRRGMSADQVAELLYQALETEKGGIRVYETALRCVQNPDLKKEWAEYLEQTQKHEQIVLETMETFGLDPDI